MNPSNSKWYQSPKFWWAFGVLFAAILIDQIIKIYIKTNFIYGESYPIFGNWFKLYFIENEGMAFGMKLFGGGTIGKLVLTFFRIIVSIFGVYYLIAIIRKKEHTGLLIAVSLVLAGAIGNIIDSVFYGYYFGDRNLLPWKAPAITSILMVVNGLRDMWLTCFTHPCGKGFCQVGSLFGVVISSLFLPLFGTSPMLALQWVWSL